MCSDENGSETYEKRRNELIDIIEGIMKRSDGLPDKTRAELTEGVEKLKRNSRKLAMLKSEQMNACTNTCLNLGTWIRKRNTVVNKVTGGGVAEFIQAVKNRDGDAYKFLDCVVVNKILNERATKIGIYENHFAKDEVWGVFENWIMNANGLEKNEKPERFVPYLHRCLREELKKLVTKDRKRNAFIILESSLKVENGRNEGVTDPMDRFPEDAQKVAIRNGGLDEVERKTVANLFNEFWRLDPHAAYLCAMRSAKYPIPLIKNLLRLQMTDNAVSQNCKRNKQRMAKFMFKRLGIRINELIGKVRCEMVG